MIIKLPETGKHLGTNVAHTSTSRPSQTSEPNVDPLDKIIVFNFYEQNSQQWRSCCPELCSTVSLRGVQHCPQCILSTIPYDWVLEAPAAQRRKNLKSDTDSGSAPTLPLIGVVPGLPDSYLMGWMHNLAGSALKGHTCTGTHSFPQHG